MELATARARRGTTARQFSSIWRPSFRSVVRACLSSGRLTSNMAFRKFVETGRVAFINEGPEDIKEKLVAIVNIIDQNRVLVDGPCTGVSRREMPIKKLHLTTLGMKFSWTASTRIVRKAWKEANIDEKWKNSRWAQRVEARKTRENLNDFERFKLQKARRTRNKLRRNVYLQLLTNAKTKGALVPKKTRYGKTKPKAKAPPKKK